MLPYLIKVVWHQAHGPLTHSRLVLGRVSVHCRRKGHTACCIPRSQYCNWQGGFSYFFANDIVDSIRWAPLLKTEETFVPVMRDFLICPHISSNFL